MGVDCAWECAASLTWELGVCVPESGLVLEPGASHCAGGAAAVASPSVDVDLGTFGALTICSTRERRTETMMDASRDSRRS
ncbi:hypothetical protein FS749_003147 [Ceratobasidium sp. UAMH 11750]|nr:hypothetical protein FS749_003147 [Ceratobasidium sp. UAMH 11750]